MLKLFFLIIWCSFVFWIGKRLKFFSYPPPILLSRPTISAALKFFVFFFVVLLFLLPLFLAWIFSGFSLHFNALTLEEKGWSGALTLYCSAALLALYSFVFDPQTSKAIYFFDKPASKRHLGLAAIIGALGWFIALPFVALTSTVSEWIALKLFGEKGAEQAAIVQLEALKDDPTLFILFAIAVAIIVPYIEELMFRGYLQSWLRRKLGRRFAILITSVIFAFAHYSTLQGNAGNFSLICPLFVVSCFIGFVYEKAQTLVAPYVFHAIFNSATLIALATV